MLKSNIGLLSGQKMLKSNIGLLFGQKILKSNIGLLLICSVAKMDRKCLRPIKDCRLGRIGLLFGQKILRSNIIVVWAENTYVQLRIVVYFLCFQKG